MKKEVLRRVNEEKNTNGKAKWIGHILRRNCLLRHIIEGKIEGRLEVTGRRGRRREQLQRDLEEGSGNWKLKEEALDRTV